MTVAQTMLYIGDGGGEFDEFGLVKFSKDVDGNFNQAHADSFKENVQSGKVAEMRYKSQLRFLR